jgi:predicted TIM-barrel fold metal-dependent hydrolase
MRKKTDPEVPLRLPIAAGAVSNGEGWWPDSARKRLIRKLVHEKAEEVSRKEGVDRREFMASACGMATTLYMINLVNGCSAGKKSDPNNMLGTGGGGAAGNGSGGSNSGMVGSGGKGGAGSASMGSGGMSGGGSGSSGGGTGGFNIPPDAMTDVDVANCALGNGGNELIIDMQSHFANTTTNQLGATLLQTFVGQINNERYPWIKRTPGCETMYNGAACYDQQEYVDQIFMGSDTTIGVLSGISYSLAADGSDNALAVLTNTDLLAGAQELEMAYPRRMLTHCMVMPNDRLDVQLAMMERNAGTYDNWKTYPPWSPQQGGGYWLDQDVGPTMIQKGLDLNSPIFCIHKGFPLDTFSPTYTNPRDVGPAANMFPAAYLVIYHSAFEHGLAAGETTQPDINNPMADVGWGPGVGQWPEGVYDESLEAMGDNQPTAVGTYPLNRGVNSLIKSLRDSGIGPNGTRLDGSSGPVTNVYAECGGVWPNLMMGRAEEAMHYWGKLLKYVGEDRLVWGTDCLWFGSPQPLIEAFRAFEISEEFQQKYGYPAMTQTRKEKILGQNAARLQNVRMNTIGVIQGCHSDFVGQAFLQRKREIDEEFGRRRDMIQAVWGPRTRREFLSLRAQEHREKLALSGRMTSYRTKRGV